MPGFVQVGNRLDAVGYWKGKVGVDRHVSPGFHDVILVLRTRVALGAPANRTCDRDGMHLMIHGLCIGGG